MNVFLKSQKLINLAVKNLSMQLENVNWTDYSWWVMMSYFGAKSSFRLIFFGRSLGFFKRQRNKKFKQFYDLTLSLRFFGYFFCYDIKFMFWEKFMVFYSFQEKDWLTNRRTPLYKILFVSIIRETQIFALFEWHLQIP